MSKRCCVCGGPVWNGRCSECGMPAIDESNRYHLNEDRSYHEEMCETPAQRRQEAKRTESSYESMMFNQEQEDIKDAKKAAKNAQSVHFNNGSQLEREHQNERNRQSAQMRQNAQSKSDVQSGGVKGGGSQFSWRQTMESARSTASQAAGQRMRSSMGTAPSRTRSNNFSVVIVVVVVIIAVFAKFGVDIFRSVRDDFSYSSGTQIAEEYEYDPYEYVTRELSDSGESFTDTLSNGFYRVGWQIPEGNYTMNLEAGDDPGAWVSLQVSDYENGIMLYENFVPKEEANDSEYQVYEVADVRLYEGAYVYVSGNSSLRVSTETGQVDQMTEPITNTLTETFEMKDVEASTTYTAGTDFPAGMYDLRAAEGTASIVYETADTNESFYFTISDYDEYNTLKELYFAPGDTLTFDDVYTESIAYELIPSEYTYEDGETDRAAGEVLDEVLNGVSDEPGDGSEPGGTV